MTLPKSHKNPAAYSEHMQPREHAPIGTTYGLEKGAHPNRRPRHNAGDTNQEGGYWEHINSTSPYDR